MDMPIRIVGFDELPRRYEAPTASLVISDNDPPIDPGLLRKNRALGQPCAEYLGLAAIDGPEVLAQLTVERHRVTTETGTEVFAGVSGVVTRPDVLGRGLSGRLFEEMHRREAARGMRLALLWTRRTWAAHRLYEKLGYRDVYIPPTALLDLRRSSRRPLGRGYSVRSARREDAPLLETLLRAATRHRLGLVPRYPGSFRVRFAMKWRSPSDHHLLLYRSRPVGYFFAPGGPFHVMAYEAVVPSDEHRPALLDAMEREASGRWLAFGYTSFVREAAPELRERGGAIFPESHVTLMAKNLSRTEDDPRAALERAVADPRFSCQRGDVF